MNSYKRKSLLVVIAIVISLGIFVTTNRVMAQTHNLTLSSVQWQGTIEPGAKGVTLRIEVLNVNNQSIKGITGNLSLAGPFIDSTDSDRFALATGQAVSTYINVSQYTALAGEPFQLTYTLDIAENATKGKYNVNLNITYFLEVDLVQESQVFSLTLTIPNRVPIIDWIRPEQQSLTLEPGEVILFSAGGYDPDNDSLTYEWFVNDGLVSNKTSFNYIASNNIPTTDRVKLVISDGIETISKSWTININELPETEYSINTQYLEAGSTTTLEIVIKNNLWNDTIECGFSVQQPLVIKGNATETFENITSNDEIVFRVNVFTPTSVIGQTGAGTLSISYTDKYKSSHSESYNIGLIVKGRLKVTIFDSSISGIVFNRGKEVRVTGTLLNTGNIAAQFTNVSLRGTVLSLSSKSRSYLGELEPDSPMPFSLVATINTSAPLGKATIECIVFYQDDIFEVHSLVIEFSIEIIDIYDTQTTSDNDSDLLSSFSNSIFTIILLVITISSLAYITFRYYKNK